MHEDRQRANPFASDKRANSFVLCGYANRQIENTLLSMIARLKSARQQLTKSEIHKRFFIMLVIIRYLIVIVSVFDGFALAGSHLFFFPILL
ncbi:hypothetical protein ABO04_10220 [Nitrosomonas sp. HPC101]|nr:hypothetical protein [Nitrosomonas sp. HPC101]